MSRYHDRERIKERIKYQYPTNPPLCHRVLFVVNHVDRYRYRNPSHVPSQQSLPHRLESRFPVLRHEGSLNVDVDGALARTHRLGVLDKPRRNVARTRRRRLWPTPLAHLGWRWRWRWQRRHLISHHRHRPRRRDRRTIAVAVDVHVIPSLIVSRRQNADMDNGRHRRMSLALSPARVSISRVRVRASSPVHVRRAPFIRRVGARR